MTLMAQLPPDEQLATELAHVQELSDSALQQRAARPLVEPSIAELAVHLGQAQRLTTQHREDDLAVEIRRALYCASRIGDPAVMRRVYAELASSLSLAAGGERGEAARMIERQMQQTTAAREEQQRLENLALLRQEQLKSAEAERRRQEQQITALRAQGQLIAAERGRQQLMQEQHVQQLELEGMARRNRWERIMVTLLLICFLLSIALAWSLWRVSKVRTQQAFEDPLTGLKNRRFLTPYLDQETERLRRAGNAALLLMIDIDHFKNVNDIYGHEAGDDTLIQFATIIRRCVRNSDIICRWGGEEFVVVCPNATERHCTVICQRICNQLERTPISISPETQFQLTASIGGALYSPSGNSEHWEAALARADRAMYSVKQSGRNNWMLAGEAAESGEIANTAATL